MGNKEITMRTLYFYHKAGLNWSAAWKSLQSIFTSGAIKKLNEGEIKEAFHHMQNCFDPDFEYHTLY